MAQYTWVIVVIVLIGVVQFFVYQYLRGRNGASPLDGHAAESPPAFAPDRAAAVDGTDAGEPATGRRCPACGATNDPAFTFCRRCVARIGAGGP